MPNEKQVMRNPRVSLIFVIALAAIIIAAVWIACYLPQFCDQPTIHVISQTGNVIHLSNPDPECSSRNGFSWMASGIMAVVALAAAFAVTRSRGKALPILVCVVTLLVAATIFTLTFGGAIGLPF